MSADSKVGIESAISSQEWCAMGEEGKRAWLMTHGAGSALQSLGIDSPYSVQEQFETGNSTHAVWGFETDNGSFSGLSLLGSVPSFTNGGFEINGKTALAQCGKPSLQAFTSTGSMSLVVPNSFDRPIAVISQEWNGYVTAKMQQIWIPPLVRAIAPLKDIRFLSSNTGMRILVTTEEGTIFIQPEDPSKGKYNKYHAKMFCSDDTDIYHNDRPTTLANHRVAMQDEGLYIPSLLEINDALRTWGIIG